MIIAKDFKTHTMKKRILLFAALGGFIFLTLSSESGGPASQFYQNNRTGAKNSATTCGGGGCHGSGSGTTVNIELDSAGVPVTSYMAGMTYTVKIMGNSTSNNLKFGFEFVSVSGTGNSQVQAGTASSFPANVGTDVLSGLTFVEHHATLTATSAGVYNVSFQWTAPTAGTGTVKMYSTLNAVNGNGDQDAGDISGNISKSFTEQTGGTAVSSIPSDVLIAAYPNPVNAQLNLKMENAGVGTYTMNVFDISGKRIMADNMEVSSSSFAKTINTAAWVPGYYSIQLIKDGAQRVISVVKQ